MVVVIVLLLMVAMILMMVVEIVMLMCFVCHQEEPLGGWTIQRQVGKEDPVVYKFASRYILKAQSYSTVSDIFLKKGGRFIY